GSAARPYSVSVGFATTWPPLIQVAASSMASRCGASRTTKTRRIVAANGERSNVGHGPVDHGGKPRHDCDVDEKHDPDARATQRPGDERTARHPDQRRAREHAEAGAVRAGRNHAAGGAVRSGHRGANAETEQDTCGAHHNEIARGA